VVYNGGSRPAAVQPIQGTAPGLAPTSFRIRRSRWVQSDNVEKEWALKAPPPPRVSWPVMYHQWNWISFIHWRYPPAMVEPILPAGLRLETFDGSAWIGLTPFLMEGLRAPVVPAMPWVSRFPETNVRTYVRDDRGRSGIWFLSLDAARLPAVLAARVTYRLPYFWSDMAVHVTGSRIDYRCRRRLPSRGGARCDADVALGAPLDESERDKRVHFLTARFRLFTLIAGRLAAAEAEHQDWPLHHAELRRLDQDLVQRAGLPPPPGDPLVHASPGVAVKVGMWRR
jgi:uncharacterized protein YqjF (DUF2071 family)